MTGLSRVEMKGTARELFVALLTLLSVVNLVLLVTPLSSGEGKQVVLVVELALTPFFLADFLQRLVTARPPRRYLLRGYGWADLVAVAPLLRFVRLVHVAAVVRSLRARGPGSILEELSVARAVATFYLTIFLVIVVLELCGALVLVAEAGAAGANITTPGDALWWGYVTITTVGYGDQYPVTVWGRLIGFLLLTSGVALFSVLTGFIANAFLSPRRRSRRLIAAAKPGSVRAELEGIYALLDEHEERAAELRSRMVGLERALIASASAQGLDAAPPGGPPSGPGGGVSAATIEG